MEWYSFCSYMGPNQERLMDQMVSRLSVWPHVSFIKTGTYKGIGQRLIGFRVYVSVVVRQCYRPRLIKLVKIWKPLLLLLRLRVRQGRCCVEPVIRSKNESLNLKASYYKFRQLFFITKYDTVYYKLPQVLQSAMNLFQIAIGITKCDDYHKLRQYGPLYL